MEPETKKFSFTTYPGSVVCCLLCRKRISCVLRPQIILGTLKEHLAIDHDCKDEVIRVVVDEFEIAEVSVINKILTHKRKAQVDAKKETKHAEEISNNLKSARKEIIELKGSISKANQETSQLRDLIRQKEEDFKRATEKEDDDDNQSTNSFDNFEREAPENFELLENEMETAVEFSTLVGDDSLMGSEDS